MNYPTPTNEDERLDVLQGLNLVGAPGSVELDAAVELAAGLFNCPLALVTVLDAEKQWFRAKFGLKVESTAREHAFCNYTIEQNDLFVIEDTQKDARFRNNPYVVSEPGIRFYAGRPISIDGEHALGAICLLDTKPRKFAKSERDQFHKLAEIITALVRSDDYAHKVDSALQLAKDREADLERHSALLEKVTSVSGVGGWEMKLGDEVPVWTKQTRLIHEVSDDYEPNLSEAIDFYAPEARPTIKQAVDKGINEGVGWDLELPLITAKGRRIWARAIGEPTYTGKKLTGIIGTLQDISQKKAREKRLKLSEKLAQERTDELNAMLSSMNQGVSMFDAEGNLLVWNDKYTEIFDKDPNEVENGVSFKSILLAEKLRGDFAGDVDQSISDLLAELSSGKTVERQFELTNGKIIRSVHAPLIEGGWVCTHDDVTAQIRASREMTHAARHDPLTGLANRLNFNSALSDAVELQKTQIHKSAVLLIDLDGFKLINDTYGHQMGDDLLKAAAERLSTGVRSTDLAARLGGDEFALIVRCEAPGVTNLETIAQRLLKDFEQPFVIGGREITIGVSIGISFIEDVPEPIESAICNADSALYKVKAEGRNNYCIFDSGVNLEITQKRLREIALRDVVKKRDFKLFYQPVHALSDNSVAGYEALIRWDSKEHEQQNPMEFIPMAEELGLIDDIGNWVIDTAVCEASKWKKSTKLAINVSPRQLGKMDVFRKVAAALSAYGFPANKLELEITEYAILQDDGSTMNELRRLKDLGVHIVLDDFGTGYSSLSYLHRFPFDKLKIDRSFVEDFQYDARRTSIIRAIKTLAIDLGIEVTVEGIETEDQFQIISSMGCTYAQGYYLGRPQPASDSMRENYVEMKNDTAHLVA